jgi:hypothetical protein
MSPLSLDELRERLERIADQVVSGISGPTTIAQGANKTRDVPCPKFSTEMPSPSYPDTCTVACPKVGASTDVYCAYFSFEKSLLAPGLKTNNLTGAAASNQVNADVANKVGSDNYIARKNEIRKALANLVLEAISYSADRNVTKERHFDWPLLADKNFIVIFVDKETYDAQPDWKMLLRVNRKGKPDQSLYQRPVLVVTKQDFDPNGDNKPLRGRASRTIYWAAREMTGDIATTVGNVEAIKQLKKAYEEWQKVMAQK